MKTRRYGGHASGETIGSHLRVAFPALATVWAGVGTTPAGTARAGNNWIASAAARIGERDCLIHCGSCGADRPGCATIRSCRRGAACTVHSAACRRTHLGGDRRMGRQRSSVCTCIRCSMRPCFASNVRRTSSRWNGSIQSCRQFRTERSATAWSTATIALATAHPDDPQITPFAPATIAVVAELRRRSERRQPPTTAAWRIGVAALSTLAP